MTTLATEEEEKEDDIAEVDTDGEVKQEENLGQDEDEEALPRFRSRPSVRQHTQHKEMMEKINELTAANYHSAEEGITKEEEEEEEFVHFESKESYQEQPRSSSNTNFILRHGSLQQILALRNSLDEEGKEEEEEVDRSSVARSPVFVRSITMNGDFGDFTVVEPGDAKPSAKTTNDPVVQVTIEPVDAKDLKIDIALKKIAELEGNSRVNSFRIATPVSTTLGPTKVKEEDQKETKMKEEDKKERSKDVVPTETPTVPIEVSESSPQQLTMTIETEELERIEAESNDDDSALARSKSTMIPSLEKSAMIPSLEKSTKIPALEKSMTPGFERSVRIQKPTRRAYQPATYQLPPQNHPGYVLRGQLYHVVQQPRLRIGHPGFRSIQRPPYPPSFLPPLLQYSGRAHPIYRNI